MQNVNLIDRALIPTQPLVPTRWVVVALVLAALAVGVHALAEKHWTTLLLALETPASEATAQDSDAAPDAALAQRVAQRAALLAVLEREIRPPADPAGTLLAIVAALPGSMWLTEVELSGARGLRITGGALEVQALGEIARRLERPLAGVGLATLRLEAQAASGTGSAAEGDAGAGAPAAHRFALATPAEGEGTATDTAGGAMNATNGTLNGTANGTVNGTVNGTAKLAAAAVPASGAAR